MSRPRRMCRDCGVRPVGYGGRLQCYVCKPHLYRAVVCRRCGSSQDYFSAGLCRRCHRSGGWIDSCVDCLAWGVTRRNDWRCEACRGWRARFGDPQPDRPCLCCRRVVVVNKRGYCRLCCKQVTQVRAPHTVLDVIAANRAGQQLFLANMLREKYDRLLRAQALKAQTRVIPRPRPGAYPVTWRQLLLFDEHSTLRDIDAGRARGFPAPPLPDLAAALHEAVTDHAARHGWGEGMMDTADYAIRVLLAL